MVREDPLFFFFGVFQHRKHISGMNGRGHISKLKRRGARGCAFISPWWRLMVNLRLLRARSYMAWRLHLCLTLYDISNDSCVDLEFTDVANRLGQVVVRNTGGAAVSAAVAAANKVP